MPLLIAGTSYSLPSDPGQKGLTGEEIDGIEAHFGIDALVLLQSLGNDEDAPIRPGYTRNRAIFSVAWIALNRGGVKASLGDVMRDYALDDFGFEDVAEAPAPLDEPAALEAEVIDPAPEDSAAIA